MHRMPPGHPSLCRSHSPRQSGRHKDYHGQQLRLREGTKSQMVDLGDVGPRGPSPMAATKSPHGITEFDAADLKQWEIGYTSEAFDHVIRVKRTPTASTPSQYVRHASIDDCVHAVPHPNYSSSKAVGSSGTGTGGAGT